MNVLEVHIFMGLTGYYQRFVEGFSKIENPIMELKKKNKKFVWTEKCVKEFQNLKELLMKTLLLKVSDMDKEFFSCKDTSKEGLGRVLMQYNQVFEYMFRKLRRHEEKYTMHDMELLAIVYSLRVLRHYLIV
jgi:hypothetical protein